MTTQFICNIQDETVEISLQERRGLLGRVETKPVSKWEESIPEGQLPILVVINNLVEEFKGTRLDNGIVLPHEAIVGLTEAQARLLGLPPSVPFAYDIRANGMIDQPEFSLSASWVNSGGVRELGVSRRGAFVVKQKSYYRIPSPVYEIIKASEALHRPANDDKRRYQALAELQDLLPKLEEAGHPVKSDKYFASIRIMHASSFSLQIPTDGDGFQFNPVLFSRKAVGRAQDDGRLLDEAENLLTPSLQSTFAKDRFKRWSDVRDCYAVDQGIYVYIDPDLKKALSVVRHMQQADAEERKKFIRFPHRIIKEKLAGDIAAEAVESLFVETEQYAENVIGLGLWEPPVIPWIIKQPNSWLPEKFGLKIGDTYVQISPDDIGKIREEVSNRIANPGMSDHAQEPLIYDGVKFPTSQEGLKEALEGLEKLSGVMPPDVRPGLPLTKQQEYEIEKKAPQFLLVEDNLEEVRYHLKPVKRLSAATYDVPVVLKSTLKKHQNQGLKWLIDSWSDGVPGVLLADDMGLGKTLQALTFLAWLKDRKREGHPRCKEPVLIVAPTGLLGNWQKEIAIHLREPYLGEICKAYGHNLSAIRIANQNDLMTGQINIDRNHLRQFDVVLTTYETYRDYHHSFGGIRFSAAVLDECQKIKNPKSQVNRALASMNAEFVIGMTGTPVENAMEDLWTILDRAWPGFLGDLKSFSSTYSPDDQRALAELTRKLKGPATDDITSPVLWRRMKEDILDDLPKKVLHPYGEDADNVGKLLQSDMVVTMPQPQADAYLEAVMRAKEQEPPPMLFTLHKLRGISLHPINPEAVLSEGNFASYDKYIGSSARLMKTIEILDVVHKAKDKALIFIETLAMQSLMADIIKKRYGLMKRPDIINGKTGADRIQRFVDEFQADPNFDVMILSPKVGGVGLTLTAANHVIHLSRWWNPAVEDQSTDRAYRIGQTKDVHVYCPMAVHPDTHIRENSFDLKLNAMLERKRKLSRDMLIPPESSGDTEGLFNETVGFSTRAPKVSIIELDRMDARTFEQWVLTTARQGGYVADGTNISWDEGADGIIRHKTTGQRFILQCKHSNREKIEEDKVIQDLLRARSAYDLAGDATLVALTNVHFSSKIMRRMEELKIIYFDRDKICNWPEI